MKMIKVLSALSALILTGCDQYVANPKELSDKMAKCDSIGMDTILLISSTVNGDVKVKCLEKTK